MLYLVPTRLFPSLAVVHKAYDEDVVTCGVLQHSFAGCLERCVLNAGDGNDGRHNKIESVFWWAWNANSGDTGGIVQQDWLTINWNKVDWMASVGLKPWYANQGSSSSEG